ncbi:hypothetical protein PMAYCL1PPCAC_30824, partial [Pristionchus mayeri]
LHVVVVLMVEQLDFHVGLEELSGNAFDLSFHIVQVAPPFASAMQSETSSALVFAVERGRLQFGERESQVLVQVIESVQELGESSSQHSDYLKEFVFSEKLVEEVADIGSDHVYGVIGDFVTRPDDSMGESLTVHLIHRIRILLDSAHILQWEGTNWMNPPGTSVVSLSPCKMPSVSP